MQERRERRRDVWLETGRQIVDGVSGRRPGQRRSSLDLDSVGRWVGDKVDWLLEDDDNWREPWQDSAVRSGRGGKRPLEAISRRQPQPPAPPSEPQPPVTRSASRDLDSADAWPDEDSFRVDRWQRSRGPQRDMTPPPEAPAPSRRALPRSSRRRA